MLYSRLRKYQTFTCWDANSLIHQWDDKKSIHHINKLINVSRLILTLVDFSKYKIVIPYIQKEVPKSNIHLEENSIFSLLKMII